MFSFLITLLSDITQTGILIFLLYDTLSSVLNLKLVLSLSLSMTLLSSINSKIGKLSLAKTKLSSSNSSIKGKTSSLIYLIILK